MTSADLEERAVALERIGDYLGASYAYMEAAWAAREEHNVVKAKELLEKQNECMEKG